MDSIPDTLTCEHMRKRQTFQWAWFITSFTSFTTIWWMFIMSVVHNIFGFNYIPMGMVHNTIWIIISHDGSILMVDWCGNLKRGYFLMVNGKQNDHGIHTYGSVMGFGMDRNLFTHHFLGIETWIQLPIRSAARPAAAFAWGWPSLFCLAKLSVAVS